MDTAANQCSVKCCPTSPFHVLSVTKHPKSRTCLPAGNDKALNRHSKKRQARVKQSKEHQSQQKRPNWLRMAQALGGSRVTVSAYVTWLAQSPFVRELDRAGPINTGGLGDPIAVPNGWLYSSVTLTPMERRTLAKLSKQTHTLIEAKDSFNLWWRDVYVDGLGRDKLVGVELNPGPGRHVRTTNRNRAHAGAIANSLADSVQEKQGELDALRQLLAERGQPDDHEGLEPAPKDKEKQQVSEDHTEMEATDFHLEGNEWELIGEAVEDNLYHPSTVKYPVRSRSGWVMTLVENGQVTAKHFFSVAQVLRLQSRGWSSKTAEAKVSLLSQVSDNPYPYLRGMERGASIASQVKMMDIYLGDDAPTFADEYAEVVRSDWPTENGKPIRINVPDLNITHRAHLLLPVDRLSNFVFPINPEELRKAADKRLRGKFRRENWNKALAAALQPDTLWRKIHGSHNLVVPVIETYELRDGSRGGFFEKYADDMAHRKGLNRGETKSLRNVGKRCDELAADEAGQEELLTELGQALSNMNVFIKDEAYEKTNTTLRFIVSPPPLVKVLFGAVLRPVEDILYAERLEDGHANPLYDHHVKHMNPDEVRDFLMRIGECAQPGEVFYETDYSAYEVCQGAECLNAEYGLYKSYYDPDDLGWKILEIVRSRNVSKHMPLKNKGFSLTVEPMRWSGMPNTALGNLLMNVFNLLYAAGLPETASFVCEGDDALIVADPSFRKSFEKQSIFAVTCDCSRNWSDLSFCGHKYDETWTKVCPDDDIMISKILLYFSRQPLSPQKAYELLYLRFMSYQMLYPNWPGFADLAQMAEKYYRGRVVRQISEKTYREWFKGNWWKLTERFDVTTTHRIIPSPDSSSHASLFPLLTENLKDEVKERGPFGKMGYSEMATLMSQSHQTQWLGGPPVAKPDHLLRAAKATKRWSRGPSYWLMRLLLLATGLLACYATYWFGSMCLSEMRFYTHCDHCNEYLKAEVWGYVKHRGKQCGFSLAVLLLVYALWDTPRFFGRSAVGRRWKLPWRDKYRANHFGRKHVLHDFLPDH